MGITHLCIITIITTITIIIEPIYFILIQPLISLKKKKVSLII